MRHSSFLVPVLAILGFAALFSQAQAQQDRPRQSPGISEQQSQEQEAERTTPTDRDKAPSKQRAKKPLSPLALLMKDGIPKQAAKRVRLRDDLYALLATAPNAKEAKKIAAQIRRIWVTSGSDTVSLLMSRAGRALKAKDKKLALSLLDHVVELAPDHAEAWHRRGFVHYSMKNFRAAVGDLRRAVTLDKSHFKVLDGLATIFQEMGDDTSALKFYDVLSRVYPHFPGLKDAHEKLQRKVEGRGI